MTKKQLTHLDKKGHARMVDVADKAITSRSACAQAIVRMQPETWSRLVAGETPKGDVFAAARIAGIQAAKRTPDLIPLCHHIALTGCKIEFEVDGAESTVTVVAETKASDRTGVEMEALTAASVAALTMYDMLKSVERGIVIESVRLLEKQGGKSGPWSREVTR